MIDCGGCVGWGVYTGFGAGVGFGAGGAVATFTAALGLFVGSSSRIGYLLPWFARFLQVAPLLYLVL